MPPQLYENGCGGFFAVHGFARNGCVKAVRVSECAAR